MEWYLIPSIGDVQESLGRHYEEEEARDMDLVLDFWKEIDSERFTRHIYWHNFKNTDDQMRYAYVVLDEIIDALVAEREKEKMLEKEE